MVGVVVVSVVGGQKLGLGEENQGFYMIMANFLWERLIMALGAVGAMQLWFSDRKSVV